MRVMRNCLTYAVGQWRREGGYLLIRRSRLAVAFRLPHWHPLWWVPHFLHMSPTGRITQYRPSEEQSRVDCAANHWWAWVRLWHFDGEIVEGD